MNKWKHTNFLHDFSFNFHFPCSANSFFNKSKFKINVKKSLSMWRGVVEEVVDGLIEMNGKSFFRWFYSTHVSYQKTSHFKWNHNNNNTNFIGIIGMCIQRLRVLCSYPKFDNHSVVHSVLYFQFVIKSAPFIVARVSLPKVLWTKGWKINSARKNTNSEYNK